MIAGIGLNVNQTTFVSGAPNPISIKQITRLDYDLEELMNKLLDEMNQALATSNREYYMAHLYRREGFWPFVEREVSTAPTMNYSPSLEKRDGEGLERPIFLAKIEDVRTDGELELRDQDGNLRTYHFKQIRYVL
jgi:BirA family biotin operon repressor/biotin-[acetyl-CoA-carboxylase] ligase